MMIDDSEDLGQHIEEDDTPTPHRSNNIGSKLIRVHEPVRDTGGFRLPDIEMHLWHITYHQPDGTSLLFDPRTTEITRKILSEVFVTKPATSYWYDTYLAWTRYFHKNVLSVYMQQMYHMSSSDTSSDTFNIDTFIDHIQSYILRDYDIQRLDHQPETEHIEWNNLYWMGYAYHLHVVISRGKFMNTRV